MSLSEILSELKDAHAAGLLTDTEHTDLRRDALGRAAYQWATVTSLALSCARLTR